MLGRAAGGVRHGPRVIDVDVLLLGALEYYSARLTLPHAEVSSRVRTGAAARARSGLTAAWRGRLRGRARRASGRTRASGLVGPPLI